MGFTVKLHLLIKGMAAGGLHHGGRDHSRSAAMPFDASQEVVL